MIDSATSPTTRRTERLGTGFIVAEPGVIATAHHVVDAARSLGQEDELRVGLAGLDVDLPGVKLRSNFSVHQCQVVAEDVHNDVALLKAPSLQGVSLVVGAVEAELASTPIEIDDKRPADGGAIATSGYPFGDPVFVTNAGIVASAWATDPSPGPMRERYLADMTANPGNSGGAVYNVADARAIGVCVGGRLIPVKGGPGHQTVGVTIVVPIWYVMDLISSTGIEPAPVARSRSTTTRSQKKRKRR